MSSSHFYVVGVSLPDNLTCLTILLILLILLQGFQKMTCIFRSRRITLDMWCCVFFLRIALSGLRQHARRVAAGGQALSADPSCKECVFLPCRRGIQDTLHSTLYTCHFTLYTPHFTLRTLLYTPHSTLDTLQFTLHIWHSTLYILHFATLLLTLHTLHSTLYTLHFTLHTLQFTLRTPYFTL